MVSDKISLHRLHTMFSLLSLKRAWVVTAGQLVGVVAVPELTREIIGAAHSFNRDQRSESMSSLIPMYDIDNNQLDESDDEDVIHDSTQSYRIQSRGLKSSVLIVFQRLLGIYFENK